MTPDGFLNLNKPAGLTSHDCVARVRRLLKTKRVGHGGTLDPAATGVLPVAVGRATRLLQYLPSGKAYNATVRFGLTTATDDLEGEILTQAPAPTLTLEQVQVALGEFQGTIQQIPPRYSAIQVQGQRLYDLARAGVAVEVPMRTVQVDQIEILDWRPGEFPELAVAIACGPGTYIRSIARDLGSLVGTGATLAALERTASSGFTLAESLSLEEVAAQTEQHSLRLVAPEQAIAHLPVITLAHSEAVRWCQGQKLSLDDLSSQPIVYRVHHDAGHFLGVGEGEWRESQWVLAPRLVFETHPQDSTKSSNSA